MWMGGGGGGQNHTLRFKGGSSKCSVVATKLDVPTQPLSGGRIHCMLFKVTISVVPYCH